MRSVGGPPPRVPFRHEHLDHLAQICNPSRSFRPHQDRIRLPLEARGFLSPTGPDDIGSLHSQAGKTVKSSLKDL